LVVVVVVVVVTLTCGGEGRSSRASATCRRSPLSRTVAAAAAAAELVRVLVRARPRGANPARVVETAASQTTTAPPATTTTPPAAATTTTLAPVAWMVVDARTLRIRRPCCHQPSRSYLVQCASKSCRFVVRPARRDRSVNTVGNVCFTRHCHGASPQTHGLFRFLLLSFSLSLLFLSHSLTLSPRPCLPAPLLPTRPHARTAPACTRTHARTHSETDRLTDPLTHTHAVSACPPCRLETC
jgi:hypothetical protein